MSTFRSCFGIALALVSFFNSPQPPPSFIPSLALEHPYLRDFHGQMDEPYSGALFDFDFERTESISGVNLEVARNEVRARIFEEVLLYRPALEQYS